MVLNLLEKDHHVLDKYLNAILDAYKLGEMDQLTSRSELAHMTAAAARDNVGKMSHVTAVLERRA